MRGAHRALRDFSFRYDAADFEIARRAQAGKIERRIRSELAIGVQDRSHKATAPAPIDSVGKGTTLTPADAMRNSPQSATRTRNM